jgi:uncharacterized membrane protein
MNRFKTFVKISVLGGLAVILPTIILLFLFGWLFRWITAIIQPLTNLFISRGHFQELVADILGIATILAVCFVVGIIVKTKAGRFIQENLERRLLNLAPGYTTIKSMILQFIGRKESAFSSVALVRPFENKTLLTAFITETHADGFFTVFVPTGPNPTSGFIFHLPAELVHPVKVPVEDVLKSVIGCGVGSKKLLEAYAALKIS